MKPLIAVSAGESRNARGGKTITITSECGITKTITGWAEHFKVKRRVIYGAYKYYSMPTDKILKPDNRIPKHTLRIWREGYTVGLNPQFVKEVIQTVNDNHVNERIFRCDNGHLYTLPLLAMLKGLKEAQLRTRGYILGWLHPNLLDKRRNGYRLDGTKITGQGKSKKNRKVNSEWNSFTDESRL